MHHRGRELYEASWNCNVKDVIKLLEEGAPVSWRNRDRDGQTSLHVTCIILTPLDRYLFVWHETTPLEVMKVLLEYKANVNQQDDSGHTPLHFACRHGLLDRVKILLATGQCDLG